LISLEQKQARPAEDDEGHYEKHQLIAIHCAAVRLRL
jgi:hypothetical protein